MTFTINPGEDLGMQIERLIDPLRSKAEEEAENRQPTRLDLPPVPFPHSDAVKKVIADYDKLWNEWVEANSKLVDVLDDYTRAASTDDAAIRKAARDGADKSPGRKNTETVRDSLEWALAVATAKREAVNHLVGSGRLEAAMRASLDYYLGKLSDIGAFSEGSLRSLVAEFRQRWNETRGVALRTMASFDYFGSLVRERYGLSYGSQLFDAIPELRLPNEGQLTLERLNHAIKIITAQRGTPLANIPQGE